MEYTNELDFCISCHEMEQNVYQEYKKTIHYQNRTGVRAICSDCHVPKEWGPKLLRKIYASRELYYWAIGEIDTPEKFEAHRQEMAERVWATMKENNSRECRNCHSFDAMHFDLQSNEAKSVMKPALEEGRTCIECHKGIAHQMPNPMLSFQGSLAGQTIADNEQISIGPQSTTFIDQHNGDLATLMPGSPATALTSDDTRALVAIEGWSQANYTKAIMKAFGQRIIMAELTELGEARREVMQVAEDDYGERWQKVRIQGWVDKAALADSEETVWDLAETIYSNRCGNCHGLYATTLYTANQWPGNLDAMADFGGLIGDQYVLVRQFLQTHAKEPVLVPEPRYITN